MNRKLVTAEVAQRLGMTRQRLATTVLRNPHLKPAERLPSGHFLWSDEEIAAFVAARRGPGQPRKNVK